MFIIILFSIKQLQKLWKKTFQNIYQLSCFVGHPVVVPLIFQSSTITEFKISKVVDIRLKRHKK